MPLKLSTVIKFHPRLINLSLEEIIFKMKMITLNNFHKENQFISSMKVKILTKSPLKQIPQ